MTEYNKKLKVQMEQQISDSKKKRLMKFGNDHAFENESPKNPVKKIDRMRLKEFKIVRRLGKGASGEEFLAMYSPDQQLYILKKTERSSLDHPGAEHQAFLERAVLSHLEHPGIASLQASFQTEKSFWLVLSHEEGGSLLEFVKDKLGPGT